MQFCTLESGLNSRVNCEFDYVAVFLCIELSVCVYVFISFFFFILLAVAGHSSCLFPPCLFSSLIRGMSLLIFSVNCVCLSCSVPMHHFVVSGCRLCKSFRRSFSNCSQNMLTSLHSAMSEQASLCECPCQCLASITQTCISNAVYSCGTDLIWKK